MTGEGIREWSGPVPSDPRQREAVAALKRIFELWTLDGAFQNAYGADPQKALASTGLDVDPKAADLLPVFYEIMRWGFKHENEVFGGSVG